MIDQTFHKYFKQNGTKKIRFERSEIKTKIYLVITFSTYCFRPEENLSFR